MSDNSQSYQSKVSEFLDTIEPGAFIEVDKICIPENKIRFVEAIKFYMRSKYPFQGYISFTKDYSKFYKTNPITFKNETDD